MTNDFLVFTPRIIPRLGLVHFRIQKRSKCRELLEEYQDILNEHGIVCTITGTKNRQYRYHLLQIHGDNVFLFLDFVNDFKRGEEWKQICARKIRQMAEMRKLFTR